MSLKSYLQSLINVLLKKSIENTSPGDIVSTQTVETATQNFISPVDGYAYLESSQASSDNAYITLRSTISHQHIIGYGYVNNIHIPVKKGVNVQVEYSYLSQHPVLRFVARVGGGLSAFCRKLFGVFGEVQYA